MTQIRTFKPHQLYVLKVLTLDDTTTPADVINFTEDYNADDHDRDFCGVVAIPSRIWEIFEHECKNAGGILFRDTEGANHVLRSGDSIARSYDGRVMKIDMGDLIKTHFEVE